MKKFLTFLVIGLLVGVGVWGLAYKTIILQGIERTLFDGYFFLREQAPAEFYDIDPDTGVLARTHSNPYVSDRVQLVAIDDRSLGVLGKWPWYRDVHARYLDTVEKFSPSTVHFDVAFVLPEKVPDSITKQLADQPEKLAEIQQVFGSMDRSFAGSLARYDNDFIDLFVFENPRPDSPYIDRIRYTESVMARYSIKAPDSEDMYFRTLEPIVENILENSQPVTVSQWPDKDEVMRSFLAYHPYQADNGEKRYYLSVVLALLTKFYHIDNLEQIEINRHQIVLHDAMVPDLDQDNQLRKVDYNFRKLQEKITISPTLTKYNENLYSFLVNESRMQEAGEFDRSLRYPLHLLRTGDDAFELIDGLGVYRAAKALDADRAVAGRDGGQVSAVLYTRRDVVIRTEQHDNGREHVFPINFGGSQEPRFINPVTGQVETHYTIPTQSYAAIFAKEDLPDLPVVGTGLGADPGLQARIRQWYSKLCEERYNKVLQAIAAKGEALEMENILRYSLEDNPADGKYFLYKLFLDDMQALEQAGQFPDGTGFEDLVALYPDWLAQQEIEQATQFQLDSNNIIADLQEEYTGLFDRYYNKIVFTGPYTLGMAHDLKVTPYGNMYGVNVIIHAFNTIVTENQLSRSPMWLNIVLLFLGSIVLSVMYGYTNIRLKPYLFLLTFVATFAVSYFILFANANYLLKTIPLALANLVAFITVTIYKVLTEEKDKKFLKATFAQYISPELIDTMYEHKTRPSLGGTSGVLTAYFTDIQSFSSFSEKLTATQLVELLNEYLSAMTDLLLEEKGTLDKYEGDAIIAFFGAPMQLRDHALRACRVAIGMQNKLLELRKKWQNDKSTDERNHKKMPPEMWAPGDKWPKIVHGMRMRIGINTGEIVTGNMGSTTRMNYTMMGDSVNLAARLEAGAKQYGVFTMISENTLRHPAVEGEESGWTIADFVEARFIDNIAVVGKSEPVKVYELICMKGDLTESEETLLALFDEAVELYLKMQWQAAREKFTEALQYERFPDAKINPSLVYIKRCEEYSKNPPVAEGEEWDGVFRLTSK